MLTSTHCLDCGTELSQERWSGGLCPRCLLVMALESPSLDPAASEDPDVQPTLAYSTEPLAPGRILGKRYQIRSLLGRGGMGEVWRAFDLKLRVDVALKALRRELLEDERALELLRSEVRSAREVVSPNVCRLFDLVELDGQELVSMEYIDGKTLLETLRSRGPLELEEAREIASQFLAGLEAIHSADLVHRDLKPENLMLTRSGRVVVMDFGIAKGLAEGWKGTISGTPAYMAPEQVRGEAVDARADVFSAGVVLAEMIAPEGIRQPTAREAVWRGIHSDPPELPDTPWSTVLGKAVAQQRDRRFDSAAALARALEEVTFRVEGAEDLKPYPGLASFTEEDAEYFFGRELEVEAMWRKLRRPHLLGLIGPSGAGKSSFLRAGLLPVIPEGWRAVICTPGRRPFIGLARVLADELAGDTEAVHELLQFEDPEVAVPLVSRWRQAHEQALIIVDQFEELFTLNPPEVQGRFAEHLGRIALEADVHVLLSMRDDFLYHCHAYAPLTPLLDGLTLMSPPVGAALRRAVVQPALKCGYRFEDEALVDEILGQVQEERGALPMLAFAAARLWEKRDRDEGLLTREAYKEIGGVGGALAQHAETTLEQIGLDRIPVVREIFRNLVTAQGTRAARDREELLSVFGSEETAGGHRAPKARGRAGRFDGQSESKRPGSVPAGVGGPEAAAQVLDTLIDARLLTSYEVPPAEDEDTGHHRIEIIHESLLTNWPRLVRWQTQDAEGAQLRDELRQSAQMWDQHDRSADLLWTGTAFREFQLWRERYPGGLSELEEEFAGAMTSHAQRRKRRRRIALAAAFAVLLTVVGIVTVSRQQAVAEARRAEAAKLLALAQLELDDNHTAALAWATASLELSDSEEARRFAVEALWHGPTLFVLPIERDTPYELQGVAFSPDGRWMAAEGLMEEVYVWSEAGGEPMVLGGQGLPKGIDFGPHSDVLLVGRESGVIQQWSVPEWKLIRQLAITRGAATEEPTRYFFIMTDDRLLTFTSLEEHWWIRSWPLEGGEVTDLGHWSREWSSDWDFDPTGTWLAFSRGREVYRRPLASLESTKHDELLGRHESDIDWILLSPDGRQVAATDESGEIRIWSVDPEPKRPLRTLHGLEPPVACWFNPSGSKLATHRGAEKKYRIWDLVGPPDAGPIELHRRDATGSYSPTFHPSGRWLVVPMSETLSFWPLGRSYPRVLTGHSEEVSSLVFVGEGDWIASASAGGIKGEVRLWPLSAEGSEQGRVIWEQPGYVFFLAVDPRGERLLISYFRSTYRGGAYLLRLVDDPSAAEDLSPEGFIPCPVAFSPDGRHTAIGTCWAEDDEHRVIRVRDLESGSERVLALRDGASDGEPTPFESGIDGLQFTPEGQLLASGHGGVRRWDLETGAFEWLVRVPEERFLSMAASRDGRRLLTLERPRIWYEGHQLTLHDLDQRTSRAITSHGEPVQSFAMDPTGSVVVTGDTQGLIRVGPADGSEPHLLFRHESKVWTVALSPDGRWLASGSDDTAVRLWPMPDLSQPPLHTLPLDELIAKLHSLTNLRVVRDEEYATGWKLEVGPFPGWKEVPTW